MHYNASFLAKLGPGECFKLHNKDTVRAARAIKYTIVWRVIVLNQKERDVTHSTYIYRLYTYWVGATSQIKSVVCTKP